MKYLRRNNVKITDAIKKIPEWDDSSLYEDPLIEKKREKAFTMFPSEGDEPRA